MSEEPEGQDTGAEAVAGGADSAAMALALGGASREDAGAFLKKQSALIDDQRHHLNEQFKHQLKQLRLKVWEAQLGVLLRVATGFVGLAVAAGLALMIWDAAHADGLVIEAFSVPPDMANRGLSGQVVAAQMLDKLIAMQNGTGSVRPAQSYANNWGDDLKVEIPETGVSIGEVYRFLRGWLGHETHVTGEVYRTATGIAVTARTGADVGGTFAGAEADLDDLVQKAAEHVYGSTQPFRYAFYLMNYPRQPGSLPPVDEARAIFTRMTSDPDPFEHAWAWGGMSLLASHLEGNERAAAFDTRKAIALDPDFTPGFLGLSTYEIALGHAEAALAAFRSLDRSLNRRDPPNIDARFVNPARLESRQSIAFLTGDYTDAVSLGRSGAEIRDLGAIGPEEFRDYLVVSLARQHDGIGALTYWRDMPPSPLNSTDNGFRAISRLQMDAALENWQAVVVSQASVERTFVEFDHGFDFNAYIGTEVRPIVALAKAKLGETSGAEAVVATTASDCYDCTRIRGMIASEAKQYGRADYWFARAVQQAPSIPFAYADWGAIPSGARPARRGDREIQACQRKRPALRRSAGRWGEALMAKNQSRSGAGEIRGSRQIRAQLGTAASEMGRGAVLRRAQGRSPRAVSEGISAEPHNG